MSAEPADTSDESSENNAAVEQLAENVAEQFAAAVGVEIDVEQCAAQLAENAREKAAAFSVPAREGLRSSANDLFDMKEGVSRDDYTLPSEDWMDNTSEPAPEDAESGDVISLREIQAFDIDEDDELWPDEDLVANVVYLNDDHPNWLAQIGLLSDGASNQDSINFNIYASSAAKSDFDLEDFEPVGDFDTDGDEDLYAHLGTDREEAAGLPLQVGDTIRVRDYVVESYDGRNSVYINGATSISKLDESVDTRETATITGPISAVKDGSGLIERCPEEGCNRVLDNGRCYEHGEVDGEDDLRIKAVVEAHGKAVEVIFNREFTEQLTGIELEDAQEMAMDALDREVVIQAFRGDDGILGQTVTVEGTIYEEGGPLIATDVVVTEEVPDPNSSLVRARAL